MRPYTILNYIYITGQILYCQKWMQLQCYVVRELSSRVIYAFKRAHLYFSVF